MKAYQIGDQTDLASLTLVDRAPPVPAPGEIVVEVKALCLNHRDLNIVSGRYGPLRPAERIPTSDGAGRVIALGDGVEGLSVGDRVTAGHFVAWTGGLFHPGYFARDLGVTLDGWLAEQISIPASAAVKIPDGVSDTRAAALPAAGLTAWNAVVEAGRVKAGDWVLAIGTGGVSIFALQIAKMHGARVIITSSSDEKLEAARAMGADVTINYRTHPDWASVAVEASGSGADIVIETGGQATLVQSIAASAPNGRIALIGALGGATGEGISNFGSIIGKNLILRGITSGSRSMLQDLIAAVDANNIDPLINADFAFDRAADAYAHLQSGSHLGKVMIKL